MLTTKISHQTLFSIAIIILCGGWSSFIPLTLSSAIYLLIGLYSLLVALHKWKRGIDKFDIILFNLSILIPVISAIQSYMVFGQPLITGLLSMRTFLNILFVYYLINKVDSQKLISILASYQLFIMAVDAILLYGLNIDNNALLSFIPSDDNAAYVKEATVENAIRGVRLDLGIGFTWLIMAYWSSRYYYSRNRNDLIYMLLTLLFVFSVSKSRVSLVICFLIMIMPLFFERNSKNMVKLIILISIVGICVLAIPAISQRFLVVFDLFGDTRTEGSGDFSGVARLGEILVAIPYIINYPIFGVGNISYHYNGGFMGVLGEYFFLADIGIVGMMFMGGLFYCVNYYCLFNRVRIIDAKKDKSSIARLFVKIVCVVYMLLPLFGYSPFMSNPTYVAVILFIMISISKSNRYEANLYR